MEIKADDDSWANFDGPGMMLGNTTFTATKAKRSSKTRHTTGDTSSTSRWMAAPIDSEDLLPLAPPGVVQSPRRGSAASRVRLSIDIPVKSARRPETISSFSRKKSISSAFESKDIEHSTRTKSTSTADSTSDSDKEQLQERVVSASFPSHAAAVTSSTILRRQELHAAKLTLDQREMPSQTYDQNEIDSTEREGPPETDIGNTKISRRGRAHSRSDNRMKVAEIDRIYSAKLSTATRTLNKPRGRSISRSLVPPPIEIVKVRGRSSSQPRLPSAATTPRGGEHSRQGSGRSQYPPTTPSSHSKSRNRSRSASASRASNDLGAIQASMHSTSPSKRAAHRRPPSTFRTRQELRGSAISLNRGRIALSEGDANSVPSLGGWNSVNEQGSNDITGGSSPLLAKMNKKVGLREKLFGDQVDVPVPNRVSGVLGCEVRPRVLLAATVYHNTATNLWIATINTNQRGVAKNPAKANKYLKAYSFATECEARESAIANAPPKMVPFNESPVCFNCKGKFAVFRRAGHCRNCGVCVCNACSVAWPAKMIPDTYNLKNEAHVKVCRSCNTLSSSLKIALLNGDWDEAFALYRTGNVNLRTPFAVSNKKDESMYPVHCAAEGGNINILRWLINDRFCPVKVHTAAKRGTPAQKFPVLTSKGRSVLSIAIESLKVDMMRYLVVELGVSIYECKDLRPALTALEAALSAVPRTINPQQQPMVGPPADIPSGIARWDEATFDDNFSEPSSLGADDEGKYMDEESKYIDETKSRASCSRNGGEDNDGQLCIICFDRKINCVGTPCGHAVCCLECTSNLELCPVCNDRSAFIKIFRP